MEAEVFALKPDLIANCVLMRSDISGPFLMSNKEGRSKVRAELREFEKASGNGRGGGRGGKKGDGRGLIAHEGTERGSVDGGTMTDIMSKFSSGKVVSPVILADRAVGTKVLFKFLINLFSLTICLRMVGRTHGLLDS